MEPIPSDDPEVAQRAERVLVHLLCWLLGTSVLEMGGLHPHNLSHLSQHIAITKKDTCQEKR